MPRCALIIALVLHSVFTRLAAAQGTLSDTLTDSLRHRFQLEGHWLRRLPIDDPRHALVLIPGVRLTGVDMGITPAAALMIRGSPAGRNNVYVDGALLRFETRDGAGVGLAPNAIDELGVLTGVVPAYLSDAAGGAIWYESRSGGERLGGGLRLESDEPFSDRSSVGFNRLEGSLGGPVAAGGNLTFFLSTTLQGQQSSYRGPAAASIPAYLRDGIDTLTLPAIAQVSSGLRRPLDWSSARRAHAKLAYRYGELSNASITLLGGELQQRFFPGQFALIPQAYGGARLSTVAAIVNWQHELRTWRGGPLTLDVNLSLVRHRNMSGPLDSTAELATRDPALGIAFRRLRFAGADILDLPTNDALIRALRSGLIAPVVPLFGRPDFTQGYASPYGTLDGAWTTDGYGGTLSDVAERRVQGRWSVDWWRDERQRVALGFDLERSNVSSYTSNLVRSIGLDAFTAKPTRFGLFADGRFAVAGATIDLGVRFDRSNPGGDLPSTPGFITSSGSALWNPNSVTDDTAYANSVARVFRPASAKSVLSPRIRFEYPVAAATTLRLGFSRTVEPPAWATFFVHANNDLAFTSSTDLFARDVDFGIGSVIEGGVRHIHGPVTVDIGVYRKGIPSYVGRLTPFVDVRDTTNRITLSAVTPVDLTRAQGVDLGVDVRRGWLTASGAYSLARITSSRDQALVQIPEPVTTHSAAVAVSLQIPGDWNPGSWLGRVARGTEIVFWGRAQSGTSYQRLTTSFGDGATAPMRDPDLPVLNAEQLPTFKRLDLRIAKTLRTRGHAWSIYFDARNLLNFSNLVSVFRETGDTANVLLHQFVVGDPVAPSGAYARLRNTASGESALEPDGTTVNVSSCGAWANQLNCVALNRVERRFGNGDQLFTVAEQQQAFESYYRDFFSGWRFVAPGRTIRIGMELAL